MNKLVLLALAVASVALADHSCHGQDWRDPSFQQPLPQYYPPNRYPLGNADGGLPQTNLPTQANQSPATTHALKTPLVQPAPMQSNTVKSFSPAAKKPETPKLSPRSKPSPSAKKPIAKRLPAKKPVASKTDKKKKSKAAKEAKPDKPSPAVVNYDIYRDGSQFPIDPRKPRSVCRRSVSKCRCGVDHGQCGPGNQGQPYQDKEPGGFACGKNCTAGRPMFSVYWPRPFSAKRAKGHPHRCNCDQCAPRINDRFDHLINFKLIDYHRTDNGHFGPGADPYGCLGESKYQGLGM